MSNLRTETPITQEPDVSTWLTPKDVQRELRIGQKLAYKLLKDGTIPSIRVSNLYRVRREALDDLRESAMSA